MSLFSQVLVIYSINKTITFYKEDVQQRKDTIMECNDSSYEFLQ
jgi:hypothetical protein